MSSQNKTAYKSVSRNEAKTLAKQSGMEMEEGAEGVDEGVEEVDGVEMVPPDGGWGWVIVFANCIITGVLNTQLSGFGIVYVYLVAAGYSNAQVIAIPAVYLGFTNLLGPLATGLSHYYTARTLVTLGTFIAFFGMFLCTFYSNIVWFYFCFGVLGGTGSALAIHQGFLLSQQYFRKKRVTAQGFSMAGVSLSNMVFPPLIAYVVSVYAPEGTFLLWSAILLNGMVGAALFHPVSWHLKPEKIKTGDAENGGRRDGGNDGDNGGRDGDIGDRDGDGGGRDKNGGRDGDNGGRDRIGGEKDRNGGEKDKDGGEKDKDGGEKDRNGVGNDRDGDRDRDGVGNDRDGGGNNIDGGENDRDGVGKDREDSVKEMDGVLEKDKDDGVVKENEEDSEKDTDSWVEGEKVSVMNEEEENYGEKGNDVLKKDTDNVPMENKESETKNIAYENKNVNFDTKNVNFDTKNVDYDTKNVNYETKNANYETKNEHEPKSIHYEPKNAICSEEKRRLVEKGNNYLTIHRPGKNVSQRADLKDRIRTQINAYGQFGSTLSIEIQMQKENFEIPDEESDSEEEEEEEVGPYVICGLKIPRLRHVLRFSLLKHPAFLTTTIGSIANRLVYNSVFTYIPSLGYEVGVGVWAPYMLTIIAVAELVSKLVMSVVSDQGWLQRRYIYILGCFVAALANFSLTFAWNYTTLSAACGILGFSYGMIICIGPVLLVEYLGVKLLPCSFGLLLFFNGICGLVLLPFTGWLADVAGNYKTTFYVLGSLNLVPAILWILMPIFHTQVHPRKRHSGNP